MDSIVHGNLDYYEREDYMSDLSEGNFENDLNTAIATIGIECNHINSSCIYSNIDNGR